MVGLADHKGWLTKLDRKQSVSVYLHVPYCREICLYCGCNTKMGMRDEVISRYRRALEAEIGLVASLIDKLPDVTRLHWGGGTPSILGLDGLRSVLAVLGRHFCLSPAFEQAIELDPRYVAADFAGGLAELGVTRASLGVQDLNPLVQAAIGRIQPLSVVEFGGQTPPLGRHPQAQF